MTETETAEPGHWLSEQGFDRDHVDAFRSTMPDGTTLRPAIQKLTSDQTDLLADFVDGFRTRAEWVRWGQRAAVRTLGEISGEWLAETSFGHSAMSTLLTGPARDRWAPEGSDPLSLEAAEDVRRGVVAMTLLPACVRGHRGLRWDAVEYVNDEGDTFQPDPEHQAHTAMRPELSELDERQSWAVDQLLDGFDSADTLLAWMQALNEASYAEFDVSVLQRVFVDEPATRDMLLVAPSDNDHGPFIRESMAAEYLLPAFVEATAAVVPRAGELAEKEDTNMTETLI